MTIQIILRGKSSMTGSGYYVTEEEIAERVARSLRSADAGGNGEAKKP